MIEESMLINGDTLITIFATIVIMVIVGALFQTTGRRINKEV